MSQSRERLDNPAGRLYSIFDRAQQAMNATDQGESSWKIWADVFGVPQYDTNAVMRNMLQTTAMVTRTRGLVESLEDEDPDVLLEHFAEVERTVQGFLAVTSLTIKDFLSPLQGTGKQCLRICSARLSRRMSEPVLDDTITADLLNQAKRLWVGIRDDTDLDADTKEFLLFHIGEVHDTLKESQFFGSTRVANSLNQTVGAFQRRRGFLEKLRDWREKPLVKDVLALLLFVDVALNMAANAKALGPSTDSQVQQPRQISPVIVFIIEQCGTRLELPPGAGKILDIEDLDPNRDHNWIVPNSNP